LKEVIERHAVLRTSFDLGGYSQPLQLVHKEVEVPLHVHDVRGRSWEEQEEEIGRWMKERKGEEYELSRAPLFHIDVHVRGEDDWQFSISEHHAILDGWSVHVLLTELFNSYLARVRGETYEVRRPEGAEYRDFIAVERAVVESEEQRKYWEEKLGRCVFNKVPRIPFEKEEEGAKSHEWVVKVEEETFSRVKEVARKWALPLKSVLLAVHCKVLSVLTGQREITTGVVANGRLEERGGEDVMGVFLNTLPFTFKVRPCSWVELAREVFEVEQELQEYRRFPMAELQRMQGGRPLFETAFNFMHFHVVQGIQHVEDLKIIGDGGFIRTNFALQPHFGMNPFTGQIQLVLEFDNEELSKQQIEAIAGYYRRSLKAMGEEPEERHDHKSLLGEEERREIVEEWNETSREYEGGKCIHELVEEQAEKRPEAVALVFEGREMSYGELERRGNQVAERLREAGVGAEVLVGICMERSLEMVVSLLGVLKAGGAYVPMDPGYPEERLEYMAKDAGVRVLLTGRGTRGRVRGYEGEEICIEEEWEELGKRSGEQVASGVRGENLAYVIYTSGSTGRPKGTMLLHRNVVQLFRSTEGIYAFQADDVWTLFHSYAFDFSVWEIFGALLYGGKLVIVPGWQVRNPESFYELLCREKVTVLNQTPSAFRNLLPVVEEDSGKRNSVRWVIFGGEALQPYMLKPWFEGEQGGKLVNMYGITETTVHVTQRLMREEDLRWEGRSLVGRPLMYLQAYIVDEEGEAVPVGVAGELCIGGSGLGRGYWKRAGLTAERFIPNRFGRKGGERLYRSGDIARYGKDGTIEYLGRKDEQVKIRGYRIELGEIEAALGSHVEVKESVVVVREEGGEKRLVGYVVWKEGGGRIGELRSYLKERLPEYMVPGVFVEMERIPLTANGKVDTKSLPKCESTTWTDINPARTPIEAEVASVWCTVLGLEAVDTKAKFFEIGGDSIKIIRVFEMLERRFPKALTMTDLFEKSSIEAIGQHIEAKQRVRSGAALDVIQLT